MGASRLTRDERRKGLFGLRPSIAGSFRDEGLIPSLLAVPGKPSILEPPHADPRLLLVEPTFRNYAEQLHVGIRLTAPPSHYTKPQSHGHLAVHLFALPIFPLLFGFWPRVPLTKLPFAFGHPLAERAQRAFAPGAQFGRGRVLYDGDGVAVAELLRGNLYVLFDLLAQEEALVPILLRRVLDLSLPLLSETFSRLSPLGPERLRAVLERLKQETEAQELRLKLERQARARQGYLEECQGKLAEGIEFLEREVEFIETGLEEYSRRITAETRRLAEYRRRLDALRGQTEELSHVQEFDRLSTLPGVREVAVQDGLVSILTETIYTDFGKRRFRLGAFQIDIHFNGDLRIKNLTDSLGAYDHPHIHQARPCLGNIREGVAKLIGEFQLAAATAVLLDFLKTVNSSDWRVPVLYWKEVPFETL